MFRGRWPGSALYFLICLPILVLGCGSGKSAVTGKVTYEDGGPVDGGTVIAEATIDGKVVGVQGNIEKDGSFRLGSDRPGDGALPGSYRVLVMPVALGDSEIAEGKVPSVPGKYGKFETSGLTLEVKPGKNELNITIARPKAKGSGR